MRGNYNYISQHRHAARGSAEEKERGIGEEKEWNSSLSSQYYQPHCLNKCFA